VINESIRKWKSLDNGTDYTPGTYNFKIQGALARADLLPGYLMLPPVTP
jgi:hypothetical protein